jgi:hypothetical protein
MSCLINRKRYPTSRVEMWSTIKVGKGRNRAVLDVIEVPSLEERIQARKEERSLDGTAPLHAKVLERIYIEEGNSSVWGMDEWAAASSWAVCCGGGGGCPAVHIMSACSSPSRLLDCLGSRSRPRPPAYWTAGLLADAACVPYALPPQRRIGNGSQLMEKDGRILGVLHGVDAKAWRLSMMLDITPKHALKDSVKRLERQRALMQQQQAA